MLISTRVILLNCFKYKRKSIKKYVLYNHNQNLLLHSNNSIPKVLFFGTDNFSLPSLKALHNSKISLGTVTSFKSPANGIRLYAEQHKLPLYKWPVTADICNNYDLGVVVSFGHMIPTHIIEALPLGMINVHASLLPRWRGAAPIIYALTHGDTETGVSIMKIEPKHFDIGDILAQRKVLIKENVFMPELHTTLANEGADLLLEVINDYHAKLSSAKKQNEKFVTYAPKVSTNLTEINWAKLTATDLYNRHRALYSFKNLNTKFQGKNIQLLVIKLPDSKNESKIATLPEVFRTPGSFVYIRDRKCLLVCCAAESFIEIHQLRVEGRKTMTAQDFNNGFLKNLKTSEVCFSTNKNVLRC